MKICPSVGSYNLAINLRIVLFPEPLLPTITYSARVGSPETNTAEKTTYTEMPSLDPEADIAQGVRLTAGILEANLTKLDTNSPIQALAVFGERQPQRWVVVV